MEIYRLERNQELEEAQLELRNLLSSSFGVTVQGNRVTLRWNDKNDKLKQAHMVLLEIDTETDIYEREEKRERYKILHEKFPKLREELFWAETGEHSK